MPAPTQAELETALEKLNTNLTRINSIVNGNGATIVTVDGGLQIPSFRRFLDTALVGSRGPIGLTGPAGPAGSNGVDGDDGEDAEALWPHNRPGEQPELWTSNLAGLEPLALAPLADSLAATGSDGKVIRIVGANIVAPRKYLAPEPARVYQIRYVVRRRGDTSDPSGDAVRLSIYWYDQNKVQLSTTVVVDNTALYVATGRYEATVLISRTAGSGITTAPANTRYVRPFVQTYGTVPVTDVEIIDIVDVSSATIFSPALGSLQADVDALESIDADARLIALEAQLSGPTKLTFLNQGTAVAYTIPATVQLITLVGSATYDDNLGGDFIRTAGGVGLVFTTADGAQWKRKPGSVLDNIRLAKTAAHTVANIDNRRTLSVSGGYYAMTFGAASGYDADFSVRVVNENTNAAVKIVLTGGETSLLWPKQEATVFNQNNVWYRTPDPQRMRGTSGLTFYANFALGDDTTNDGLGTGTGRAWKTLNGAAANILKYVDMAASPPVTISMVAGNVDSTGFHFSPQGYVGGYGSNSIIIDGNGCGFTGSAFELFYSGLRVKNLFFAPVNGVGAFGGINVFEGAKLYLMEGNEFAGTHGVADIYCRNAYVEFSSNFNISAGSRTSFISNSGGRVASSTAISAEILNAQTVTTWVTGVFPGTIDTSAITWELNGFTVTTGAAKCSSTFNHVYIGATACPGSGAISTATGGQAV